jgi:hypothetical protein
MNETIGFITVKNMHKSLLVIILLCTFFGATAQRRKVEKLEKDRTPSIKLSYISRINLNNPGFVLGAEFMMQRKKVDKSKFSRTKEKFLTVNFSIFDEPDIYTNMSLYAEWLKRTRYKGGGFFTEAAAGFGLGKGINYERPTTYVRNLDGTLSVKKPENNLIIMNLTLGLGYDFMPKKTQPIKVFAKAGLYPIYHNRWPYNTFIKMELGVITALSVFKKK